MPRRRNKKTGRLAWWSDSQRIEAVTTWMALGNLTLTAATLNIPRDTLARWKGQEWWGQMVREIQAENNMKLDGKLSKIVDKSVDALMDRVENGDFVFNQKTGKLIRKPVNARDVNKIAADMIDRRTLLQTKVVEEQGQQKVEEHLKNLAEEFKKFAKATTIEAIPTTTYEEIKDGSGKVA